MWEDLYIGEPLHIIIEYLFIYLFNYRLKMCDKNKDVASSKPLID